LDLLFQRMGLRAATIDERLSDAFEASPNPNGDSDLAARRLSAWRQSCAAGDPSLFARRLERDGLSPNEIEMRFTGARLRPAALYPPRLNEWLNDAIWVEAAFHKEAATHAASPAGQTCPFETLFAALIEQAERLVWSGVDARVCDIFGEPAIAGLRLSLLGAITELCAPALYERFAKMRDGSAMPDDGAAAARNDGTSRYTQFVADMQCGGFRRLFEDKPVLLRLVATLTRQWIDTTREFVARLAADLPAIHRDILRSSADAKVIDIKGGVSDPHNDGRSVLIVRFTGCARIAYKPKDLQVDVAWRALVERLNGAGAPVALKTVRTLARDGYGWTEFIEHTACADMAGCASFFRRAGAWLALMHCFAATDIHQENMIAAGDHPVPIDLETILQPSAEEHKVHEPEGEAFDAAMEIIGNSVMTVGLLPAHGRSVDNNVFAMGGMTAEWGARTVIRWNDINTDAMRPAKVEETSATTPNLPHLDGRYAEFGEHIESFISGFADYANFLSRQARNMTPAALLQGFAGLAVRKVVRPTRFYYMLLRRLRNHRSMTDGVTWSAQADFIARLADWDRQTDPLWPLHRAERTALVCLNVPHFLTPSDGTAIHDAFGISVQTAATPGLHRARARLQNLDQAEIAWQVEVIRENTNPRATATKRLRGTESPGGDAHAAPDKQLYIGEAGKITAELSHHAIRRGPGAAWIGLDWLGDSDVFQLVCLGPDLYNGATGIAFFLAAHAAVTASKASRELALAGVAHIRKNLKSRNAPRLARSLGIGAATGLGSIVYALAAMGKCLGDAGLREDAENAARLFTDELIAADKQLDVMGGSAGAILALLRLHRDIQSDDVLARAIKCGEHLLAQDRVAQDRAGPADRRSWAGQGLGRSALNGMSHGAAGFAYALASLAAASGREEFAEAAAECIAFEDASYDADRHNWPDLRAPGAALWPCQWCHGAPGIGLARVATARRIGANAALNAKLGSERIAADIDHAVAGVKQSGPNQLDTLCCGALGSIEFLCEAASVIGDDLRALASQRLAAILNEAAATGDYRWNSGKRQFNLGLFRGLAGVGYSLLRQADASLPNVLIWE
jgi:type 2 lantibiotic biosynthesis protein LanM